MKLRSWDIYDSNGAKLSPKCQLYDSQELQALRTVADNLARRSGSTCVRQITCRSEVLANLSHDRRLARLIPSGLQPVRSILFDKTQDANWPVIWHQDLTIEVDRVVDLPGYGPWSTKNGVIHVQPPVGLLEAMAVSVHSPTGPGAV